MSVRRMQGADVNVQIGDDSVTVTFRVPGSRLGAVELVLSRADAIRLARLLAMAEA